uniref:NADH dehydrogenase subunit 2 n=1 Tax=Dendroctonus rufipennis TaxID=77170 RepID=UPI002028E82F|nr:NADH dehydrogenase subunit 2 [Dendroctonus rufipennis]UQK94999.1 NADH dehydrogenase subunit 2 [Dendroctonus rufipennis]
MYNFYKLIFYITLVLGTLLAISSSSWIISWIGLELNLLSIIPLMKSSTLKSSEATIKYFITQAIASSILLFSVILISLSPQEFYSATMGSTLPMLMVMSALMMKMGAAPFHSWVPEVSSGLNWMMVFTVLTIQKLAPMVLIMYTAMILDFMFLIILLSSFVGSLMGLNQVCLKKLLAYSSINHIGWMLASLMCSYSTWLIYYLIYCLMNFNIMIIFNKFKISYLSQLNQIFSLNKAFKIMFMMNFLSLGGLPPFLGFLPKWMAVNQLINIDMHTMAFLLIISSLISLYFYLRITFTSLTLLTFEKNSKFTSNSGSSFVPISCFLSLFSLPLFPIINLL